MVEPILEMAWPPQSLRKSRSRVRAPENIAAASPQRFGLARSAGGEGFPLTGDGDERIVASPGGGNLHAEGRTFDGQRDGNCRDAERAPGGIVRGVAGGREALGRGTGGGGGEDGGVVPEDRGD